MGYAFTCAVIGLCACLGAYGDTSRIYQHNTAYNDPSDYHIDQYLGTIKIYRGDPNQMFQFEAVLFADPNDPNSYQTPGDINLIQVDPNASGTVIVTVVADPNFYNAQNGYDYGADTVGEIYLTRRSRNQTGYLVHAALRDWARPGGVDEPSCRASPNGTPTAFSARCRVSTGS